MREGIEAKGKATMSVKCEIYRDSMQNYKKYGIPKAQLVIADVPYNLGNNIDWLPWEKDPVGKYPKIHPTQKPVCLLKKLIGIFTDPGDVVIDPCCGSGSTLRAAMELGRPSYRFEIDRNYYDRAKNEMLVENYGEVSMRTEDKHTGQQNIFDMLEVLP